jgi:prevent-host-death family protein
MTSSQAGRSVANLLNTVAREGVVVLTRYGQPAAVVLSLEEYERLVPPRLVAPEPDVSLNDLAAEFDALFEKMQTPEAQAAYQAAFGASPQELGAAAALKFAMTNL